VPPDSRLLSELRTLRRLIWTVVLRGVYPTRTRRQIIDSFHRLYFDAHLADGTWRAITWLGIPIVKTPLDLWIYQEIVAELRPALIVETGTAWGGSALYLATLCDALGSGKVVTIDVRALDDRPLHPRITYLAGSSTSSAVHDEVRRAAERADGPVVVILDSDHHTQHVRRELELYGPLVTEGSYLIVEDTNVNGHPAAPEHGPGPAEAVTEFLTTHPEFAVDRSREKLLLTFNPGGYLRRR
jgi:cephalosporin hydroxylase